jgi:hypothetical protein
LIPFGIAHFLYLDATAGLVPSWLPSPVALAYFTGGAYIVAGLATLIGVLARLAVTLSAWETGLISVLVWLPRVVTGNLNAFQWGEVVVSVALTGAAWVVVDSYGRLART